MTKRLFRTALIAVLCLVMLAASAGAISTGGATTTTAVNFRNGPGTGYGVISTLPAGAKVVVSSESGGGWAKVVYNGTTGYISSDYLSTSNELSGSFGTGTINASSVRMRSGPSTGSSILGTYSSGTSMTVTGVSGSWYKVEYNGTTGYVRSDYMSLSGAGSTSNTGSTGGGSTASGNGTVKGNDVRMRSGPSTSHAILGTYNNGTALTITGTENGWTKVTIGGVSGYIRSDYVSASGSGSGGTTTTQTGYINGSSVRMRSGAGTSYSILGTYNTGTSMTITGSSGNWYAVSYNGTSGYVCKDYMTTTKPGGDTPSSGSTGYIKGNSVRMRSGAGTSYSILGTYNNGTPLTITGTSGEWTAVTINGVKGYVNSTYVTTSSNGGSNGGSTNSTGGQLVVETAKKYLGYPYVYGGMSPSGFDCSGFVNYVYKLCGYSMSRVASSIYYNNGTHVDKANLQPGDLVFFSNSSESIGHVGIYIGGNQFIHASSSTVGVIISDLNSSYYQSHYVGAKRIIT